MPLRNNIGNMHSSILNGWVRRFDCMLTSAGDRPEVGNYKDGIIAQHEG